MQQWLQAADAIPVKQSIKRSFKMMLLGDKVANNYTNEEQETIIGFEWIITCTDLNWSVHTMLKTPLRSP